MTRFMAPLSIEVFYIAQSSYQEDCLASMQFQTADKMNSILAVSYTHLTLPTILLV